MRCTLIFSDLSYPAFHGIHQQSIELVRFLARNCEDLQIFIYCREETGTLNEDELASTLPGNPAITVIPYSGSNIRRGFTNLLLGRSRLTERAIADEVALFNPDIIHLDMAVAAGLHRMLRTTPGVISWMDPGSRRQFRLALSARGLRQIAHFAAGCMYYTFETLCRSRNKIWHVVSPSDSAYFSRAHPGQRIVQIPVSKTSLGPSKLSARRTKGFLDSTITALIFVDLRVPYLAASFELLLKHCLKPLESVGLSVQYKVLGRVAGHDGLSKMCDGLNIEFLTWVDNLSETLSEVDFVILPDQIGTGLKTRTVSVLASGCAVIGTPSAFEGIAVESGVNAIVASSWLEWQLGVWRLATDSQFRERLMRSASTPTAPFERSLVFNRWTALYKQIVSSNGVRQIID